MSTIAIDLEQAFQRYGDELYRLVLLLAPDESRAVALLLRAAHSLAAEAAASYDERALFAALVAALPPERRPWQRWRLPRWARPAPGRSGADPLLAGLARLPRLQRLALGLAMLPSVDHEQVLSVFPGDEAEARRTIRDALLALAPVAAPDLPPEQLASEGAPAECQPTRAALALGGELVHLDPALRGHLVLCAACREAAEAWNTLTTTVEHALRGALRDIRLPPDLAARLRAIARPELAPKAPDLLADTRVRLGLVALLVLALIGLLVLPRRPAAESNAGNAASVEAAPHDLVRRAADRLYALPQGSGVWHGRWEMRWDFPGGTYAPLNGDLWLDTTTRRHRVQLTHTSGGGPYEFELADGDRELWYAVTPSYGPSLYPLTFPQERARVHVQLPAEAQEQMLRARLEAGAWGLPAAYLRQALAARELRSWGRQRQPDGSLAEVIGFRGFSPLAMPPDAPEAATSQATILLTIDAETGALREVRELLGAEGGEQTGRLTWRFVSGEWISNPTEIVRTFDRAQAWNGSGDFVDQVGVADPALPLTPAVAVAPLAQGLLESSPILLPTSVPTGTLRAVITYGESQEPLAPLEPDRSLVSVYIGAGRRLEIWTHQGPGDADRPRRGEPVSLGGRAFVLQPTVAQGYRATTTQPSDGSGQGFLTEIRTFGYTRAELLDVLGALGPPSVEMYYSQARIFTNPKSRDPATFDALLQALKPRPLPPGAARHFVERVFARQSHDPDPLPDPYHLPRYRGWPERVTIDNWERTNVVSRTIETVSVTHNDKGTLYAKQHLDAEEVWYYDAATSQLTRVPSYVLSLQSRTNRDMFAVLRMLDCDGSRLSTLPDGTRVITSSAPLDGVSSPCKDDAYDSLLRAQRSSPIWAEGPYLLDVADQPITAWLYLGADGRPARYEVRAGTARDGVLLESWELASDEQVPADQVPSGTFDAQPPEAMFVGDFREGLAQDVSMEAPRSVPLTETLSLMSTPVFYLAEEQATLLTVIEAGPPDGAKYDFHDPSDFALDALRRGLVLRFTYRIDEPTITRSMTIYEGQADRFGAFLRTRYPIWEQSAPIQLTIEGRPVQGWQIVLPTVQTWALAEVDGTLLAIEITHPSELDAIGRLQRLKGP